MTAAPASTAPDEAVADGSPERPRDAGVSAVEVVFLTPIMMLMVMIIVGLGVLVNTSGVVDGAARDAARAGSIQGDTKTLGPESTKAARDAARADLQNRCTGGLADTDINPRYIQPGAAPAGHSSVAYYQITITCKLNMSAFMFGNHQITATFIAPVNTYQGDTSSTAVGP